MKEYDVVVVGPISKDINVDYQGKEVVETGGAVVQSAAIAVAGGNKTAVLTTASEEDKTLCSVFCLPDEDIFFLNSKETTSIKNQYLSADMEKRVCTPLKRCDPFLLRDIPEFHTKLVHMAGLMSTDFNPELIAGLGKKYTLAVDVQAFVRHVVNGKMQSRDWKEKKELIPYAAFLKADFAEAAILTGKEDRYEAARQLSDWGAKEVMISHHSEMMIYAGKKFASYPVKARNLSGRTGRGDTVFSAYITERLRESPENALLYATAAVSLKMETPGSFRGTRSDIEDYIKQFYMT